MYWLHRFKPVAHWHLMYILRRPMMLIWDHINYSLDHSFRVNLNILIKFCFAANHLQSANKRSFPPFEIKKIIKNIAFIIFCRTKRLWDMLMWVMPNKLTGTARRVFLIILGNLWSSWICDETTVVRAKCLFIIPDNSRIFVNYSI